MRHRPKRVKRDAKSDRETGTAKGNNHAIHQFLERVLRVWKNIMQLMDTHCHLVSEKFDEKLDSIVNRATAADVKIILNVSYNQNTMVKAIEQSNRYEGIFCSLGIQPHDANEFEPQIIEKVKTLFKNTPKAVAVGEIGLDAYYTLSPMNQQFVTFEHFLELSLEINKPVIVHVRETHQSTIERLIPFVKRGGKGVIHCFTGSKTEAFEFLDLGMMISFSGILSFKNATALQDVAKEIPTESLLIETDSPYLAPVPHRGKINEPAFLPSILSFLAQLRNEELQTFAHKIFNNSTTFFNIPQN